MFIMDVGNEYCKYRYGHVFLFNYDQMPPADQYRIQYTTHMNRRSTYQHGGTEVYQCPYIQCGLSQQGREHVVVMHIQPAGGMRMKM